MTNRKQVLLFLFLPFISFVSFAQQNSTFFLMHRVPQSNLLNPAVQIDCKWYVGIPALTSTQFNYSNTAFSFNDILEGGNLNIDALNDNVHRADLLATELHLDLISIGYRHNEYYITFNIAEKVNLAITYPGDLVGLAWQGNSQFLGETAGFNNLRTNTSYYREYSLGISKVFDPYRTFGIRAKLLFGKLGVYSGKSEMSLYTDETTYDLHLEGNITANSSFPLTVNQDANGNITGISMGEIDPMGTLFNSQNKGFAIDLGAIYRYDENITLSGSILDLGFIHWKTDPNNIHLEGSFDYSGTGLESDFDSQEYILDLRDSVFNSFTQDITRDSYYSWLPLQIYLGGMYQYMPKLGIGAVSRNVIYRNKLHSSLTLSANTVLWNKFSASLSWSYLNNTYKNIGLGLAWHGRGIQLHMVSDNVLGIFNPLDARNLNIRFGFNLMLGCPRNSQEAAKLNKYSGGSENANCSWVEKMEKKYKKKKKTLGK
ncbi:MAG: hypothetical protein A2X13_04700 [Bacteroidetes bacterium GWC2_33_15]|nr:MAG: hypothetical protein A2X10_06545 [Bacteroidetes bacterium GWA2_33_15]OFX49826.1 MAG: hypothetical protein A2X13_04700 [Bacteroidetes bacterium GWC2_33_15]OFX65017.1 MAG: hypothetical protein A2X15_06620 [Bacteroidetes bacterium GWB2_32_14]OFX69021.1 MAG: hypothetical protein A2X14_13535 [Bacteroidetes bacterium GWD2_33_33]HAN18289.1 hypothetical protein [Bacteroidales bacterium]